MQKVEDVRKGKNDRKHEVLLSKGRVRRYYQEVQGGRDL